MGRFVFARNNFFFLDKFYVNQTAGGQQICQFFSKSLMESIVKSQDSSRSHIAPLSLQFLDHRGEEIYHSNFLLFTKFMAQVAV